MRQKPYILDPCTFGGSKASENLAKILMDNPQFISKSSGYYHMFNNCLASLIHSFPHFNRKGDIVNLMSLYRDNQKEAIFNSNLPEKVKSHLWNVMSASSANKMKVIQNMIKHDKSS